jgi:hypothetical protein
MGERNKTVRDSCQAEAGLSRRQRKLEDKPQGRCIILVLILNRKR